MKVSRSGSFWMGRRFQRGGTGLYLHVDRSRPCIANTLAVRGVLYAQICAGASPVVQGSTTLQCALKSCCPRGICTEVFEG
jgi:hypothetical protein